MRVLSSLIETTSTLQIHSLMIDSRIPSFKAIFFAIKGLSYDGHKFVDQAIHNGAIVIVHSQPLTKHEGTLYIHVNDVVETLSQVAQRFYDNPSHQLSMYGVTGTNGKSSVTALIKQLVASFESCGVIGTIHASYKDVVLPTQLTTPDLVTINHYLSTMVKEGVQSCAMEVSSIGLDQRRTLGIDFDVVIFTNLTHDHLDYHGDMKQYFIAKAKLFSQIKPEGLCIINIDDPYGLKMVDECNSAVIKVGESSLANVVLSNIKTYSTHTTFDLDDTLKQEKVSITTNLIAGFNVMNLALALVSVVHHANKSYVDFLELTPHLSQVLGRMHRIDEGQDYDVIVDFAHTPDGFTQIFEYASKMTHGRLLTVFGSAGQRDTLKRKVFGQLADQMCDMIVLTEDDPRDEDVISICHDIAQGIQDTPYVIISDRVQAIRQAITLCKKGDCLLILGKGCETMIARAYEKSDYVGDHIVASAAIKERLKMKEEEKT
ncbi:MAG: UDP-N-acetylmuramoyl-L-alanyl-D-glutamate--2,6-diaminopimelate ligase [Erysipelothrix sp.]|nr:UDP-N-acetylmuramoyl-L-alanyl-D-glutamate--2,6-diaminopimelate ligase [Erysipelothrix sp.]